MGTFYLNRYARTEVDVIVPHETRDHATKSESKKYHSLGLRKMSLRTLRQSVYIDLIMRAAVYLDVCFA